MRLPCLKLAAALVMALGSASAFAGIVSVDTDTSSATTAQAAGTINLGGTRDVNILFNRSAPAEVVTSVSGTLSYDTNAFDVVSSDPAACAVNDAAGTIPFIVVDFGGLDDNLVFCTLTFTETNGADGDVEPLAISGVAPPATVTNDGQLTIQAAPANPITINFSPLTADPPANGGTAGDQSGIDTISVTTAGPGVDPGSYSCTQPAGFTLTNPSANNIPANSDPADIDVSCTLGNAATSAQSTCTRTGGADVVLTLNCPAGLPAPQQPAIVTTSPAPNSNTNLPAGAVGQTVTAADIINFTNPDGFGNLSSTIDCTAAGAVTINPAGQQTVTGAAQPVDIDVSCTLTDAVQNGSVTCAIDDRATDRTETFNFTCPAGTVIVAPSQPSIIPASSLWTKIGLFGLLAALGALVIGFRRHS